jgi:hypothetical protein
MILSFYLCSYIYNILHMRVKYTDMQHIFTYIHMYIYFIQIYIYMHACMYCNVCACVIPLCNIVLHICAMFFFIVFFVFLWFEVSARKAQAARDALELHRLEYKLSEAWIYRDTLDVCSCVLFATVGQLLVIFIGAWRYIAKRNVSSGCLGKDHG